MPGCSLELRLGDCRPLLVLHHWKLEGSLTVEVEVADVQEIGACTHL